MRYRRPDNVAHLEGEPAAGPTHYLMVLPNGRPRILTGSAALIWQVAAEGGTEIADELASLWGIERTEIADTIEDFVEQLIGEGLLETTD